MLIESLVVLDLYSAQIPPLQRMIASPAVANNHAQGKLPSLRSSQSSMASSHLPGGQSLFLFEAIVLQEKCRTHHSRVPLRLLLVNKRLVQRFIGSAISANDSASRAHLLPDVIRPTASMLSDW